MLRDIKAIAHAPATQTPAPSTMATSIQSMVELGSTSFAVSVTPASLCNLVRRWVSHRGTASSLCQQLTVGAYNAFRTRVQGPRTVVACALIGLTGCQEGLPRPHPVWGTWALRTVNGANLPYLLSDNGSRREEITADTLTIVRVDSFTRRTTVRITEGGQTRLEVRTDSGKYSHGSTPGTFTFTFTFQSGGPTAAGSLSTDVNALTLVRGGVTFLYFRQ